MTGQPHIAIVLLNYNGQQLLERFLPFVTRVTYPNKTIAVIDNASIDGSVQFLQSHYPDIVLIENPGNKGYAGGYNEGLKQISADYFILLNTDVEVSPGFIEPIVRIMEEDSEIGICQPKILSLEHRNMFEYAGAGGGFMDKYGYTFARGRILDHGEEDLGQYDQDREIFWAGGACLVVRASLFRELNGFYDYYFMYAEEVDLCWRARLTGNKIYYCHESVVYHKETTRFVNQSPRRIYQVFRNNLVMLMKNLAPKDKLIVIPLRVILNVAASFLFLLKGHFTKSWLVIKSIAAALNWSLFHKSEKVRGRIRTRQFGTIYKRSLLIDYYFRKRKRFSELDQHKF